MYLRAGIFSFGLLLLSRLLGLARESVQAAAFGSSGMADVVIVMFTLPDLLVGIFLSGALAYVLLPHWTGQSVAEQNGSQKKVALKLLASGLLLGLLIWRLQDPLAQALAPGLTGTTKALGASSLGWSAAVLPLAMLAALWVTRLQQARDFIGMYAGNLLVNALLVAALLLVVAGYLSAGTTFGLGLFLVLAMIARLVWLGWRLKPVRTSLAVSFTSADPVKHPALPGANVWIWAGLSSGLLLLLPVVGRSIASQGGEGALASFNYAWKLVELPLVLAVQLVASLAFPAITRTAAGSPEREKALQLAFSLAWALACAAVAIVVTFSLPLATLLFGWGRMDAEKIATIAQWSAIGVWSLLPQALIAVLLTVLAISQRMQVAVWAYLVALAALIFFGWARVASGPQDISATGGAVMWMLNAVLSGVALVLLVTERASLKRTFPWFSCLVPLLITALLISLKPLVVGLNVPTSLISCFIYGVLVVGSGVLASPLLRALLFDRLRRLKLMRKS